MAKVSAVERVENNGQVSYYPTFEIVAGEHKGRTYRSVWTCNEDAQRNEISPAKFNVETGEIFADDNDWRDWAPWFVPFKLFLILLSVELLF